MIKDNIEAILKNIEQSKAIDTDVLLVAVSKYRDIESIKQVYDAGIKHMAENRVQEFLDKYEALPKDISWHMIGHVQTNKVKYIIGKVCLIHSLDSIHLAEEIARQSKKNDIQSDVLLQINIAKEASKYGFEKEEIYDAMKQISRMNNINIKGLMCIAPLDATENELNNYFCDMKNIYEQSKIMYNTNKAEMKYLSMGMSNDYITAVKNGANVVRIGSAIFNSEKG
ncbi:MAG: YggS family pyridoxal phosphate-dependent enzyme [Eubacteriaceae bacterium]|nr:YggS family pyridoxal phosphate-dependent enzyme [Eubacteriaceae bacterium]